MIETVWDKPSPEYCTYCGSTERLSPYTYRSGRPPQIPIHSVDGHICDVCEGSGVRDLDPHGPIWQTRDDQLPDPYLNIRILGTLIAKTTSFIVREIRRVRGPHEYVVVLMDEGDARRERTERIDAYCIADLRDQISTEPSLLGWELKTCAPGDSRRGAELWESRKR